LVVCLEWRRATGLQHLLQVVEAQARLALVLGDGQVVEEVCVAQVGGVGVAVLVGQPFPFGCVGVACADVLGLEMLQLRVDIVAITHCDCNLEFSWRSGCSISNWQVFFTTSAK